MQTVAQCLVYVCLCQLLSLCRLSSKGNLTWGFPKLGVPFWGVPLIRTIVNWGQYWGPPHFRKLPHAYDRLSPETFGANYALSYIATKYRPYGNTRVPPGPW